MQERPVNLILIKQADLADGYSVYLWSIIYGDFETGTAMGVVFLRLLK